MLNARHLSEFVGGFAAQFFGAFQEVFDFFVGPLSAFFVENIK